MPTRLTTLLVRFTQPEPAPPWTGFTTVSALMVGLIAVMVGSIAASAWLGERSFTFLAGWLFASLLIAAFVLATRRAPEQRTALQLGSPTQPVSLILLVSLGIAITLDVIGLGIGGQFLPVTELQHLVFLQPGAVEVMGWILAVAYMVVAQPIAEELLFRGLVFPTVRTTMGAWAGLVICATAYAGFHLFAYSAQPQGIAGVWQSIFLPFLAGLYFSSIRAYTGSTRAAILAHVAFGLFAVVKALMLTS